MKKDKITGSWTWDPFSGYEPNKSANGSIIIGKVKRGDSRYKTYFGIIQGFKGFNKEEDWSGVNMKGYADTNKNGKYDKGRDKYVGSSKEIKADTSIKEPTFRGSFIANKETGLARGFFTNSVNAGLAEDVGFWFD